MKIAPASRTGAFLLVARLLREMTQAGTLKLGHIAICPLATVSEVDRTVLPVYLYRRSVTMHQPAVSVLNDADVVIGRYRAITEPSVVKPSSARR